VSIIIIKGTAGSGKSETSIILSKYFPKGVRIEVDDIHLMVNSPDWLNLHEQKNILNIVVKMASNFLQLNFIPIIIVGTCGSDNIKIFTKQIQNINSDISIKIFGLYVLEEELKRRLEQRSDDKYKDFAISKILNDEIKNIKKNEIVIDTTFQTPEKTAKKIYETLKLNNNNNLGFTKELE
jgi:tRNA A37 N6-isopentenylltransferase MiaA